MREIKFRAWDSAQKKFIDNGEGFNIYGETFWLTGFDAHRRVGYDLCSYQKLIKFQQFTGLKDFEGNEIYEGDIIECTIGLDSGGTLPHMGLVAYYDKFASFATKNDAGLTLFCKHCANTRKVIGNIYENHELIEIK